MPDIVIPPSIHTSFQLYQIGDVFDDSKFESSRRVGRVPPLPTPILQFPSSKVTKVIQSCVSLNKYFMHMKLIFFSFFKKHKLWYIAYFSFCTLVFHWTNYPKDRSISIYKELAHFFYSFIIFSYMDVHYVCVFRWSLSLCNYWIISS